MPNEKDDIENPVNMDHMIGDYPTDESQDSDNDS